MTKYQNQNRKFVISGIAIVIVIIYLLRLFDLQIMTDSYKLHADSNALLKQTIYPSRGAMYDRNGKLLVYNEPSYDVTVVEREMDSIDTLALCNALSITPEYFNERFVNIRNRRLNPGYSRFTHQLFMSQLTVEEAGVFQEKLFRFPGFYVQRRDIRKYTYNSAAHILGYIGEVPPIELKRDDYYTGGDYIGIQGLEKSYEVQLRGKKGVEVLLRDANGRIQGRYKDGELNEKPSPGKDLTLSLDMDLQLLGEKLMKGKMGSIVAIEPETGEVLALVSSPTYDPTIMVGRQRGKNHSKLVLDPTSPLLNRSIMGTYPPASIFKTAQGAIFLQEEIVNLNTTFPCYHGFVVPGLRVGCHYHASPVPIMGAISTSCNSYFCWGLYKMLDNKKYASHADALTVWKDHMVSMGFGYPLGIDLPNEKRGLIPNAQFYDKIYGEGKWNGLRIIHTAIGQGEILLTPLQMANLAVIIGNRGYFYTPHMVKEIANDTISSKYKTPHRVSIDEKYFDYIAQGMRGAVVGSPYGATGWRAGVPGLDICAKTGTAQNKGKDHAVFMGFAPQKNPKIAVSVYIEYGGWGGRYAAQIGSLIIEHYLNGEIAPDRKPIYDEVVNTNLIPYDLKKR